MRCGMRKARSEFELCIFALHASSLCHAYLLSDRTLCHDFLRLPSKRQYADYYSLIKRPISLDEIKAQLDSDAYPSLDGVKRDFDTCFRNAKKYNMKESQIWKDAKTLHVVFSSVAATTLSDDCLSRNLCLQSTGHSQAPTMMSIS
jgi:Bromodomain